jgi:hypothetical protein
LPWQWLVISGLSPSVNHGLCYGRRIPAGGGGGWTTSSETEL